MLLLTLRVMETWQRDGSCPATADGIAPTALRWGRRRKKKRRRRRKALQPAHLSHNAHTLERTHQHVRVPQQSCDRICPLPTCPPCPLGGLSLCRRCNVCMCTQTRVVAGPVFPWVGQDGSKSCSQNYTCARKKESQHVPRGLGGSRFPPR